MSKLEADNLLVLKDDTDDENGVSIPKINEYLRTQRILWGFLAKNPLWFHTCPCKKYFDGYRITIYG